jgi:integrase
VQMASAAWMVTRSASAPAQGCSRVRTGQMPHPPGLEGAAIGVKVRQHHGSWFVFLNHKKVRKAFNCGDKRAAEIFATSLRAKILDPAFALPTEAAAGALTLAAYSKTWLTGHAAAVCKKSTLRAYEHNLETHILPVLGPKPIAQLARGDCKELLAVCRGKKLAIKSLQNIARTLSTVLTEAMEEGLIPSNPAFRLGRYYGKGDAIPFKIDPFTRDEAAVFLEAARVHAPEHYTFLLAALRTGMRLGELLGLQWGDIDFAGGFLTVSRNRVAGAITTPKNGKSRRIDMSVQLGASLRSLLVQRKAEKMAKGWAELPPWVFVTPLGGPCDGDNIRNRVFYRVLEKSGLRHVRFHDLRHTFASLLIQAGESLVYIKDQLGHSSIKITVDIYGHLIPGANRAAVDRLDDKEGVGQ